MGGGHGDGHGVTHNGLTIHAPKRWHSVAGRGMCAIMWFWVFYRAKKDGPVVLGWRHPWDGHEGHDHDREYKVQEDIRAEKKKSPPSQISRRGFY